MKVETFKIKGWKKKETGLIIAENDNWVLVKHIPIDYIIDGYKFYIKKYIKKRITTSKEEKIVRVLKLKSIEVSEFYNFDIEKTNEILKWSEKKYGLIEFQDKEENELFFGKINQIQDDSLIIDMVKSDGSIEKGYDYDFSINKIRSISFESDYFQSVRLLMLDELDNSKT